MPTFGIEAFHLKTIIRKSTFTQWRYLIKNGRIIEIDSCQSHVYLNLFRKSITVSFYRIFPDIGSFECNLPLFFQQEQFP